MRNFNQHKYEKASLQRKTLLEKRFLSKLSTDTGLFVPAKRCVSAQCVDTIYLTQEGLSTLAQYLARFKEATNPDSPGPYLMCSLQRAIDILSEDGSCEAVN